MGVNVTPAELECLRYWFPTYCPEEAPTMQSSGTPMEEGSAIAPTDNRPEWWADTFAGQMENLWQQFDEVKLQLAPWQRKLLDRWFGFSATPTEVTAPAVQRPYDWALETQHDPRVHDTDCYASCELPNHTGRIYCQSPGGHSMEHRAWLDDGGLVVWIGGHVTCYQPHELVQSHVETARCGGWYGAWFTLAVATTVGAIIYAMVWL